MRKNIKLKIKNKNHMPQKINIFRHSICVFSFLFLIYNLSPAHAEIIGSGDLINNASKYDGQIIEFEGEVIGDIMRRGDFAWINVKEGGAAIGIWSPRSMAQSIKHTGGYQSAGDVVRVTGRFNRACREHGGDLDIHASQITIVRPGHKVIHPIKHEKLFVAAAFLAGILLLLGVPAFFDKIRA